MVSSAVYWGVLFLISEDSRIGILVYHDAAIIFEFLLMQDVIYFF